MAQNPDRQACDCDEDNDAADSTEVVWHNPAGYDMVRHGPPYLPRQSFRTASSYSYDRRRVSKVAADD